jgi:nicotinamide mononucleotide transporter
LPLFLVFVVSFLGIAWILIAYTDSNVPWLDSFTTDLIIAKHRHGATGVVELYFHPERLRFMSLDRKH